MGGKARSGWIRWWRRPWRSILFELFSSLCSVFRRIFTKPSLCHVHSPSTTPHDFQTQSNLEEDGMGAVIEEYLHAAGEEKARKKKEKRTKATPKKKSTRAKTPRLQASSGRKTSSTRKKKTPTKKAPSNSTKKNKNIL